MTVCGQGRERHSGRFAPLVKCGGSSPSAQNDSVERATATTTAKAKAKAEAEAEAKAEAKAEAEAEAKAKAKAKAEEQQKQKRIKGEAKSMATATAGPSTRASRIAQDDRCLALELGRRTESGSGNDSGNDGDGIRRRRWCPATAMVPGDGDGARRRRQWH
jgi:membrane protein involved in colicin uptake